MRSAEQLEWERSSELHGPRFQEPDRDSPVRLVIFGAVALARPLCSAARAIGWAAYVVDPRLRFVDPERFPDAERVLPAWPQKAFSELGGIDERTGVAALTHAPELDDEALAIALRSPAFYVGAMGSRSTQAQRRRRLRDAGLSADELARLSGPAGLDLGGSTAAEAALAILSEAVGLLHGRDGGRLTESGNAIHAAGRP